jgi:hypothetical protein
MSPSINVDMQTWEPVKKYISSKLKLAETEDEKFYSLVAFRYRVLMVVK